MRDSMRAQAMVELAVCLPALVALFVLCADASVMYRSWQVVDTASAEAARYAAQDPLASTDELSSYARSCVGHDGLVVSVDDAVVSTEPTEVRVMDSEGTWREAEASVSRRTRRVTASLDVKLVGGLGTWTVRASHTSVSSEVS